MLGVANSVACCRVLKSHGRGYIAGVNLFYFFPLVGVHPYDAAEPFLLILRGIIKVRAGAYATGINPEEGKLPDERVGHYLEGKRRIRGVVLCLSCYYFLFIVGVHAGYRRYVYGRREVIHDRVENELYAFILERRAAKHRRYAHRDGALSKRAHNLFGRYGSAVKVLLHEFFVEIARRLYEFIPVFLYLGFHGLGHFLDLILRSHGGIVPNNGLVLYEVNDTAEGLLSAYRKLNHRRTRLEPVLHHVHDPFKISPCPVHLVYEGYPRNLVLIK